MRATDLLRTIFAEHTEIIEPLSLDKIETMIRAKILSEMGV